MKILFATQEYSAVSAGGAGVYAYELTKEMAKNGSEIHIVAPGKQTFDEILAAGLIIHWLKVINAPLLKIPSYHLSFLLHSRKIISKNKIDSIHSNNNAGIFAITKRPFILTLHHPIQDELKYVSFLQRIMYFPDLIFEKIALKRSTTVVVVSHFVQRLLRERLPNSELRIIPGGIDLAKFRKYSVNSNIRKLLSINSNELIIFFPGGARAKRKGGLDLVEALKAMRGVKYKCIVSGISRELGWQNEIRSAVSEAGMDDKFIWINELDYENLPKYYSAADIVVYPSQFEGFGLPVLEALACEKALICTDTGEASYLVKNEFNGVLVNASDTKSLHNGIKKLCNSKEYRDRLSRNARPSVMAYSWKSIACETVNLHSEITRGYDDNN